jgi:hypothetical protein
MLFTLVQSTSAARVIEWPQKSTANGEQKGRVENITGKSPQETTYANK